MGHLLQLLARSRGDDGVPLDGGALLFSVKEVETTATLLASIASSCAATGGATPTELAVVERFEDAMFSQSLTLGAFEALQYDALGALLELDGSFVRARAHLVRRALEEWRRPELLFRYLEDNREDPEMRPLIVRCCSARQRSPPPLLRKPSPPSPPLASRCRRQPVDPRPCSCATPLRPRALARVIFAHLTLPPCADAQVRWLRAIFGLSEETLRMIRRESPKNVRHLLQIPQVRAGTPCAWVGLSDARNTRVVLVILMRGVRPLILLRLVLHLLL